METPICDACDQPTTDPLRGYLASGTITCQPCYNYMENEVFAYKPERDGPPENPKGTVSKPGFWDKYDAMIQEKAD